MTTMHLRAIVLYVIWWAGLCRQVFRLAPDGRHERGEGRGGVRIRGQRPDLRALLRHQGAAGPAGGGAGAALRAPVRFRAAR